MTPNPSLPNNTLHSHAIRRCAGFILKAALLMQAGIAAAQTSGWETIDEIYPGANVRNVITDGMGNLYVGGRIKDAFGVAQPVIMKSADQGVTWDSDPSTPAVDEPLVAGTSVLAAARIVNSGGAIEDHLVTAMISGTKWLVRRSLDAGVTWVTLDTFSYSTAVVSASVGQPVIDSSGTIYVPGSVTEQFLVTSKGKTTTSTVTHTLIRKSSNGTWSTLETTTNIGMLSASGGTLFGVASANTSWQVRRSTNGGATWSLVDEYRFDASSTTYANSIAADTQGNVYVAGAGSRFTTSGRGRSVTTLQERFWIVRKGAALGTQWTTIDVYDHGRPVVDLGGGDFAGAQSFANSVAVDSQGNVHVTGMGVGPQENLQHWVTRTLPTGSSAWIITDDFNRLPGSSATQGAGIAADPSGNLFAVGFSSTSTDTHGWLVRRRLAP